jgi:hypothetical protein
MVDGLEHHMITEHIALAALLAALDDMPCVPDPDPGAPVSAPDLGGRPNYANKYDDEPRRKTLA